MALVEYSIGGDAMASQRKDDWRTLGGINVPKIAGPDESVNLLTQGITILCTVQDLDYASICRV